MQGRIIKGIAGFYYVHVEGAGVYECRARGLFRKDGFKPLVGDEVRIVQVEDSEEGSLSGSIEEVFPRKNEMTRPAVANVDQALVVFAAAAPDPDPNLVDRLLISLKSRDIPVLLCFNKSDLDTSEKREILSDVYGAAGYKVFFTSTYDMTGTETVKEALEGRTTALAGPSGAGKSSLINLLVPEAGMETGTLSRKTDRGRHTTRHSELFPLEGGGYVFDTPGFSALDLPDIEKEDLEGYYPEFTPYTGKCRFIGCAHINEPDCAVKDALSKGLIDKIRYDNYKLFYEELKNRRKY